MRMTQTTLQVLAMMLSDPSADHYGYALSKATKIKGGSLYPILERLESEGWVEAEWKAPTTPGRPPRRCYRLTGSGARNARLALADATAKISPILAPGNVTC